jgi:hypothetical protein
LAAPLRWCVCALKTFPLPLRCARTMWPIGGRSNKWFAPQSNFSRYLGDAQNCDKRIFPVSFE